jgi:iron complex outermembrane receptor protein
VPLFKRFEATFAVRHDRYSDFGGTTNPKVSLKWNPVNQVMFRGSYNEGFRAPSFFQLYGASGLSPVPQNIADPVLCPQGNVAGADLSVCAIRPDGLAGGNPNLKPEESKQWSVGVLLEPLPWMSASADLWQIRRKGLIYELTPKQVIANYTMFPGALVRGANGRLDDAGAFIRAGFLNADGDRTKGVDVSFRVHPAIPAGRVDVGLDGTYMIEHKTRIFATQDWDPTVGVGKYNDRDLFVRWKHVAHATFEAGSWSTTLYQFYTSHYKDFVPTGTIPAGYDPYVHSYITYTLAATYSGFKNLKITGGVKNLFDQDPPFTAHDVDFSAGAGWDPRVADPRGRAYYLGVTYKFK